MPMLATALMARRMRKPGATLRWAADHGLCVWEAVWVFLLSPRCGPMDGAGGGWKREFLLKGLERWVPGS